MSINLQLNEASLRRNDMQANEIEIQRIASVTPKPYFLDKLAQRANVRERRVAQTGQVVLGKHAVDPAGALLRRSVDGHGHSLPTAPTVSHC